MDFIIRDMRKKDIVQVQKVARTSWHSTYEGIIPRAIQDRFLDSAYSDGMLENRLKRSIIFIAEVDGEVVGFANYSPVNKEGMTELTALYLYQAYQGKGIGTALLAEGKLRLQGVKAIYINVEKNNEIGMNFYKAKGFEVVSEFDDQLDGHTLKTVRMVLRV